MRLELSGGERHALHEAAEEVERNAELRGLTHQTEEAARLRRIAKMLKRLATRAGRDRKPAK